MQLNIPKGKYVLAVSGGVDSMVLLDILSSEPGVKLVVAHFNHGIRDDSDNDEVFVTATAKNKYGLSSVISRANLGKDTSEELARQKRYEFLNKVAIDYEAKGIITAHHQDDLIETAFINILRGTGPRGLVAIVSNPIILRPLISYPKKMLIEYAKINHLDWMEDSTNLNKRYLRNRVRLNVIPGLSDKQRRHTIKLIEKIATNQQEKEKLIATISRNIISNDVIDRSKFNLLPIEIANELIAYWLREKGLLGYDKTTIERVSISLKTSKAGTKHQIKKGFWLDFRSKSARLIKNQKCLV
jgi:tRNA(Ile)-lysidine synthase